MSRGRNLTTLLEEAQQMLSSVAEVVTSTMQQGMGVMKNYEELASDKVSEMMETKKRELTELSGYSGNVKSCVEKRQAEFEKVEDKLRKELTECYKKHYGSLDKVLAEKVNVHDEAEAIRKELQETMVRCATSSNRIDCFVDALGSLKKRLKNLSSRVSDVLKKETQARAKAAKAVYDCDKKAMDEASKKTTSIVDEAKKCSTS